jgi:hypothetical protein
MQLGLGVFHHSGAVLLRNDMQLLHVQANETNNLLVLLLHGL